MSHCPQCNERIPASTILLAPCPIWISCPKCRTELVANTLVRVQGVVIVILATLLTIWVLDHFHSWKDRIPWLLGGVAVIGPINTFITLRWGSYRRRTK